ncbi:MAG: hypothetical protein KF723_22660 [Rhizobiaceae bacterium]|nr:hypothetical protein [Rhizobiaceae bacterium]
MPLTAMNVLTGVVCIVVISLLFGVFQASVYDFPLPTWLEQAGITAIAVLIWFAIASRMNR